MVAALTVGGPALALTAAPMCGETLTSVEAPAPAPHADSGEIRRLDCEESTTLLERTTHAPAEAFPTPGLRGDQAATAVFLLPPVPLVGVQPASDADSDPALSGVPRQVFRPPRS